MRDSLRILSGTELVVAEGKTRLEWLVTNGLGGYASGTVSGIVTRRYHGVLIAALPAPLGRVVMLNHVVERVRSSDRTVRWLGDERQVAGASTDEGPAPLLEFALDYGLPVWRYDVGGGVLEKRIVLLHGQNTVHVIGDGKDRPKERGRRAIYLHHTNDPASAFIVLDQQLDSELTGDPAELFQVGLHHFGLWVDNIDAIVERGTNAGYPPLRGPWNADTVAYG